MTYVLLVGLVLAVAALAFYYGYRLDAVEKNLENAKAYAKKQTELITVFMKVIRRDDDLEEFLDKLNDCDDPAEFTEVLNARLSGISKSSTTGRVD